jgi:hypothetical protein
LLSSNSRGLKTERGAEEGKRYTCMEGRNNAGRNQDCGSGSVLGIWLCCILMQVLKLHSDFDNKK